MPGIQQKIPFWSVCKIMILLLEIQNFFHSHSKSLYDWFYSEASKSQTWTQIFSWKIVLEW